MRASPTDRPLHKGPAGRVYRGGATANPSHGKKGGPLPVVKIEIVKAQLFTRTTALTGAVTPTRTARLALPGEGPVESCELNPCMVREAILTAAEMRLRPIVMVSTAILFGLIPLALALEAGGDMLQPMAITAIGGLLMEIGVALFLMPSLYFIFTRRTANAETGVLIKEMNYGVNPE